MVAVVENHIVEIASFRTETDHAVFRMRSEITYRRGRVEDLATLGLARDLLVTAKSIEYNVVGSSHEFWIAVANHEIIGVTVLARTTAEQHTILYLHVSATQKSRGVGSALIKAVIDSYPESEFVVIPFDGTEDFYRQLGFKETRTRWEMRRPPVSPKP